MSKYSYSGLGRSELKKAITAHDGWSALRQLHGLPSSGKLTIEQLEDAAIALGLDLEAYSSESMRGDAPQSENSHVYPVTGNSIKAGDYSLSEDSHESAESIVESVISGDFRELPARVESLARDLIATRELANSERVEIEGLQEKVKRLLAASAATVQSSGNGQDNPVCPIQLPLNIVRKPLNKVFSDVIRKAWFDIPVGDSMYAPPIDSDFIWNGDVLVDVMSEVSNKSGFSMVWLAGPAGTGKTTLARQIAARLGREFFRINFTRDTEAVSLLGCTVPSKDGGVVWQDGPLTKALRVHGAVILLDEVSVAGPGALAVLHSILEPGGSVTLENGETVVLGADTIVLAADNTAGHGDSSGLYAGTGLMNRALMDRFGAIVPVDWLPERKESLMVASRAHCELSLASLIVKFAGVTRAKASSGEILAPIGPRRVIAFARALHAGIDRARAFEHRVLMYSPPEDHEGLQQLFTAMIPDESVLSGIIAGQEFIPEPEVLDMPL